MVDDEQRLIEQAQQGDRRAFRTLVQRYQQPIYFLARDLAGNHHDAEDLAQETFIRALRFLEKFRGEAKFGSWLYRITVNCYIDSRRKKQVSTVSIHDEANESRGFSEQALPDLRQHSPEDGAQARGIQEHIEQALTTLSPRERSVFVLRHYKDMPLKEIAGTLDIAEGTVKALLFRAIQRLQKALAFYRADLGLE